MNYDPEKTNERLRHIPMEHRVFIYNAAIIIEFLNQTFMPLHYFLKPQAIKRVGPGFEFKKDDFIRPEDFEEHRLSLGDIYEYYKMFRQQTDYTAPIETRYKFSVILKKLQYIKNGWQLEHKRVGRAQIVYFTPLQLRVRVPQDIRQDFPPGPPNVSQGQVETTPADYSEPEEESDRFQEAQGSRFTIAEGPPIQEEY